MRVVSVNVGLPREVRWRRRVVRTAIFKAPVEGPVRVEGLNLAGDRQADRSVHGGVDKAVYAYPAEHYPWWSGELPGVELPWGSFGENLTLEGVVEGEVCIGDRLALGTAELAVTQPRMPCFKLGLRFGREDVVKRFLDSGRSGFYLAVARMGEVAAGDAVRMLSREAHRVTVAAVRGLYVARNPDPDLLRRVSELAALPGDWREHFRARLAKIAGAEGPAAPA